MRRNSGRPGSLPPSRPLARSRSVMSPRLHVLGICPDREPGRGRRRRRDAMGRASPLPCEGGPSGPPRPGASPCSDGREAHGPKRRPRPWIRPERSGRPYGWWLAALGPPPEPRPIPRQRRGWLARPSRPCCELLADLLGQHEADVLFDGAKLGDIFGSALGGVGDQAGDKLVGGAGAGADAATYPSLQPLLAHLSGVVDQVRLRSELPRDLDKPV